MLYLALGIYIVQYSTWCFVVVSCAPSNKAVQCLRRPRSLDRLDTRGATNSLTTITNVYIVL